MSGKLKGKSTHNWRDRASIRQSACMKVSNLLKSMWETTNILDWCRSLTLRVWYSSWESTVQFTWCSRNMQLPCSLSSVWRRVVFWCRCTILVMVIFSSCLLVKLIASFRFWNRSWNQQTNTITYSNSPFLIWVVRKIARWCLTLLVS